MSSILAFYSFCKLLKYCIMAQKRKRPNSVGRISEENSEHEEYQPLTKKPRISCAETDCQKEAVRGKNGYCKGHWGGRRCQAITDVSEQKHTKERCMKSARIRTHFCSSHQNGPRCQFKSCSSGAIGSTEFCVTHGGGSYCRHKYNKGKCWAYVPSGAEFCPQHSTTEKRTGAHTVAIKRHK